MMKRVGIVAVFAMTLFSCARSVQDRSARSPAPRRQTGVGTTMERQVLNAVDAGEGDAFVRGLRARLMSNPDDLEARLALARHYETSGFPEVALEHYRLASGRWPDSAEVAVRLARSLDRAGATLQARTHLEQFTAAHPDTGFEALSWTGILQDATNDYTSGERSHRAALARKPGNASLHNNLGYNLLLQSRHADAAVEFRRALEIEPGSVIARSNLAIAMAGQPNEAVSAWSAMTDPATAHNNLGAVLIERGDYSAARRELEAALGYNRSHSAALRNLQLISGLDGGGVKLPAGPPQSPWKRFVRTLGVVFLGSNDEPASRNAASQGAAGN